MFDAEMDKKNGGMTPLPISSTSESLLGMGGVEPSPFCKTHFVDPSLSRGYFHFPLFLWLN